MPILTNSAQLPDLPRRGPVWAISEPGRQLDANLIRLLAYEQIETHIGAEVDTLVHVVSGSGNLQDEDGEHPIRPGDILYLPRRTVRGFRAGPAGLTYLTVHTRRSGLQIRTTGRADHALRDTGREGEGYSVPRHDAGGPSKEKQP